MNCVRAASKFLIANARCSPLQSRHDLENHANFQDAELAHLDDLREDVIDELFYRESAKASPDPDRLKHYQRMKDYLDMDRDDPSRKGKLILKAVDESTTPEELTKRLDELETSFNFLSDNIPDDQWFFLHELLEQARSGALRQP